MIETPQTPAEAATMIRAIADRVEQGGEAGSIVCVAAEGSRRILSVFGAEPVLAIDDAISVLVAACEAIEVSPSEGVH